MKQSKFYFDDDEVVYCFSFQEAFVIYNAKRISEGKSVRMELIVVKETGESKDVSMNADRVLLFDADTLYSIKSKIPC